MEHPQIIPLHFNILMATIVKQKWELSCLSEIDYKNEVYGIFLIAMGYVW